MTIRTVQRYDAPGRLRVVRTPEGFLLTTGKLAKPGIMVYRKADGSEIRELVTAEVLQDPVSNASLFGKAFTLEHPADDVTPDNWAALSHGTWGPGCYEPDHEDGPGLYAPVTVHTRTMLDILEDDSGPRELSPGYSVQVDDTPGEDPEFGPYDTRQIPGSRRYNHGALTEAARGGPDLTIRKDSAHEVIPMEDDKTNDPNATGENKTNQDADDKPKAPEGEDKMDAFMKEMRDGMKALNDRMDRMEGKAKDATDEDPDAEGDEDKGEDDPEKKGDSRLDWFKARRELEDLGAQFQVKADGLEDDALKAAIVKAARPASTRTDSAYIDATLDLIREGGLSSARDRYAGFGEDLVNPKRNDSDDQDTFDPNAAFFNGAAGKN